MCSHTYIMVEHTAQYRQAFRVLPHGHHGWAQLKYLQTVIISSHTYIMGEHSGQYRQLSFHNVLSFLGGSGVPTLCESNIDSYTYYTNLIFRSRIYSFSNIKDLLQNLCLRHHISSPVSICSTNPAWSTLWCSVEVAWSSIPIMKSTPEISSTDHDHTHLYQH